MIGRVVIRQRLTRTQRDALREISSGPFDVETMGKPVHQTLRMWGLIEEYEGELTIGGRARVPRTMYRLTADGAESLCGARSS